MLTAGLVGIEPAGFDDAFARRSVIVHHSLADHPLLAMDAIAELADQLPRDSVRRERGIQPVGEAHRYVEVGHVPLLVDEPVGAFVPPQCVLERIEDTLHVDPADVEATAKTATLPDLEPHRFERSHASRVLARAPRLSRRRGKGAIGTPR